MKLKIILRAYVLFGFALDSCIGSYKDFPEGDVSYKNAQKAEAEAAAVQT
ncbi:hypothetical protein AGMMS49921_12300 [Endomicrobiia bacterium]|nr:hypothetical protein AGMMS49921_12300 [Endomicrobiia bacterium]